MPDLTTAAMCGGPIPCRSTIVHPDDFHTFLCITTACAQGTRLHMTLAPAATKLGTRLTRPAQSIETTQQQD